MASESQRGGAETEWGHWIPLWGCLPADARQDLSLALVHGRMVVAACFLMWTSAVLKAEPGTG